MTPLMASMNQRSTLLIMGLLLLVLCSAIALYGLAPLIKEFNKAQDSRNTLTAGLTQGGELQQQLESMHLDISKFSKRLHGEAASLPSNQIESYIIGKLQTLVWQHKVQIVGIKPREGTKVDRFRELLFDIRLRGDYFSIFRVLNDISDSLGIVVVKHFRLSPEQQVKDPQLVVELTIAAYRLATYSR